MLIKIEINGEIIYVTFDSGIQGIYTTMSIDIEIVRSSVKNMIQENKLNKCFCGKTFKEGSAKFFIEIEDVEDSIIFFCEERCRFDWCQLALPVVVECGYQEDN